MPVQVRPPAVWHEEESRLVCCCSGFFFFVIWYNSGYRILEIKSGKTYTRHNALDNVLKDERYAIPQALVFCNENISSLGKVTYLPIYMIEFLEKEKIEEYIYSIDLSVLQ